jgi:hypothetical protein
LIKCDVGARSLQVTVIRIVRSLQRRGYDVWLDIDRLKGSTVDAMGNAVDDAELMLWGAGLGVYIYLDTLILSYSHTHISGYVGRAPTYGASLGLRVEIDIFCDLRCCVILLIAILGLGFSGLASP